MDLIAVDTCTGQRLYSFLGVAWGMISDVDIESERFRSLGNSRFTIGLAVRIAGSCRLSRVTFPRFLISSNRICSLLRRPLYIGLLC